VKKNKLQITLIVVTFISLIALVAIQISWIVNAANIQEKQFNHSVKMAMSKIVDQLSDDESICSEVASCMGKAGTASCYNSMYKQIEWSKLDSIVKTSLSYYNLNTGYEFDIVDTKKDVDFKACKKTYFSEELESVFLRNGIELKIKFPQKSEFIAAQIGLMFISSIVLIILISISFLLILKYYRREKMLYRGTRDFINNITHEFKTPITNIALANSMISKSEKIAKDEKLNQYSQIIKSEQKKLKNRVEGLLDIARIENGSAGECATTDICNIIKCTVDSYQVQLQELKGSIVFHKQSERCSVSIDSEQFQVAISNLIDNAIKYCDKAPEIKITTYHKSDFVFIEIEDNGIGIQQEFLKQIFEKYFRVPTGDLHNVKGFGIGLSTVKAIIESVKGKIEVKSKVGVGTKFIIQLPYCDEL
jgi:two-component system, OmpR family, phosphate regulon sensor histidine kinase PhoR